MYRVLLGVTALLLTGAFLGTRATASPQQAVRINELMWMGSSSSSADEWVELFNASDTAIDLTGWSLTRLSSGEQPMLTIPSGSIQPGGFFVIANYAATQSQLAVTPDLVEADVSLVNSKLQLKLYDALGALIDVADDGIGAPAAGEYTAGTTWASMERNPSGIDGTLTSSWHTASSSIGFDVGAPEFGTPGTANSNRPPVATLNVQPQATVGTVVPFDATESMDPEGEELTYAWDFGDGATGTGPTPTHVYAIAGAYTIVVAVNDGTLSASAHTALTVSVPLVAPEGTTPGPPPVSFKPSEHQSLRLNELLPNPEGSDLEGEFIEVANAGEQDVQLQGWKLTDTTHDFLLAEGFLAPGGLLALWRPTTGIALNNTSDTLFLVAPSGEVVQGVTYKGGKEGESFSAHPSGDWRWTVPTPDEVNTFPDPEEVASVEGGVSPLPIADVRDLERGTRVRTSGIISVAPGILCSRCFYLFDGSDGIQVNSSKAPFPALRVGDVVDIEGTVGESQGERRINIQSTEQIRVTGSDTVPGPLPYDPGLTQGTLTTVQGSVTEKRGTTLTMESDGGTLAVAATKASGVSWKEVAIGAEVTIVGIWRQGKLVPRNQEDVTIRIPEVLGATTDQAVIPASTTSLSDPHDVPPYLSLGAPLLGFGVIGGVVWYRRRRSTLPA